MGYKIMSKKEARLANIIHLLQEHSGDLSVRDLSQTLNVSDMTIRRDLDILQEQNLIERSHGRASLCQLPSNAIIQNIEKNYALPIESQKNNDKKIQIGKFASSLVEEGSIIAVDSGSTVDYMIDYIPQDYRLTIACCNLNVVQKLWNHPNINLLLSGGRFHRRDLMFESIEGINFLRTIRTNKVFLSASGVHEKLGLTCALSYEVISKQTLLQSAMQKILLVDSSKFGTVKTVYFANLSDIDVIITDKGISPEWIDIITDLNIELHIV